MKEKDVSCRGFNTHSAFATPQSEFLGEGVPSDYMVSGLFADDFKYNRFGAQSSKDLTASSGDSKLQLPTTARRSLREGAAKVTEFGVKWNF